MNHATLIQLENGKIRVVPDAGYVIYDAETRSRFSEVITDKLNYLSVVEEGSETPEPAPMPVIEDPLERAKQRKVAELNVYNNSDSVNSFSLGGVSMWLNFDERSRLQKAVDAKEAMGKDTMTKNWNGVEFTFPLTVWKQMLTALEDYAYDCQNVTDGHRAAIVLLQTEQEVEEYDFTSGYPQKLAF